MLTTATYIHPHSTRLQNDPDFFSRSMCEIGISCLMCGESSKKPPMTADIGEDQDYVNHPQVRIIKYSALVCGATCKNAAMEKDHCDQDNIRDLTTEVLEVVHGIEIDTDYIFPPLEALAIFGGHLTIDEWRDEAMQANNWKRDHAENKYNYRAFNPQDAIWHTDLTGSGMRCYYCKRHIKGKPTTTFLKKDEKNMKFLENLTTYGLCCSIDTNQGRCALSLAKERGGSHAAKQVELVREKLAEAPWNLPWTVVQLLERASDKRMLNMFLGPWDDRHFDNPSFPIALIREAPIVDYPYLVKICLSEEDHEDLNGMKLQIHGNLMKPLDLKETTNCSIPLTDNKRHIRIDAPLHTISAASPYAHKYKARMLLWAIDYEVPTMMAHGHTEKMKVETIDPLY